MKSRMTFIRYTAILLVVVALVVSPIAHALAVGTQTQAAVHSAEAFSNIVSDEEEVISNGEYRDGQDVSAQIPENTVSEGGTGYQSEAADESSQTQSAEPVPEFAAESRDEESSENPETSGVKPLQKPEDFQTFDPQPTTIEEVRAAIAAYEAAYAAAVETQDRAAALEAIHKPHWQYSIEGDILPKEYAIERITDDAVFGKTYFTFKKIVEYQAQPQSLEEVITAIFTFICDERHPFPRWEFEVSAELLPSNYQIKLVEDDVAFGASYYTFEGKNIAARSINIGGFTLSGSGISGDPYMIDTPDKLNALANSVNSGSSYSGTCFALAEEIDISGYPNWPGIGTSDIRPFKGSFDGRGLKISGLMRQSRASMYYGLFGKIAGATIKNIYLTLGGDILASDNTGALVGHAIEGAIIENCHVNGNGYSVSISGGRAGGLIGWTNGVTFREETVEISNCSVRNIRITTGGNYPGGFAGVFRDAKVINSGVQDAVMTGLSYSAGFAGAIHDDTTVDGCYAREVTVNNRGVLNYAAGFSSAIYRDGYYTDGSIRVRNSYVSGGIVKGNGNYIGGFGAAIYNDAVVENCYAQIDVSAPNSIYVGGFGGAIYNTSQVKNCYSNGSVIGSSNVGAFVGTNYDSSKIINCYATGTVTGGSAVGGFSGWLWGSASVSSSFFDTTMTRRTNGVGSGSSSGITAYSTKQMILKDNYPAAWNVKENFLGAAGGTGSKSQPWYIDDDVTYPYFYYQYDGHLQADTSYFVAGTKYADGTYLGDKRADFILQKNSLNLFMKSAGATHAYMPYHATVSSRQAINAAGFTEIYGVTYDTAKTRLNSLGSISATDIIAFDGNPVIEKANDSKVWSTGNSATYTYVGNTIKYTVFLANYSDVNNWENVVMEDPLGKGVELVDGTLTLLDYNGAPVSLAYWDKAGGAAEPTAQKPYYTYLYDSGRVPSAGGAGGTYVLTIYFPDFKAIADTGYITEYTLTFDGFIHKEAASVFPTPSNPSDYTGHIRNDVAAVGDLVNFNDSTTVISGLEVTASDEDEDPIYNKYTVTYHNSLSSPDTKKVINGYYLTDGSESHTVLENTEANSLGFEKHGYRFAGWEARRDFDNAMVGKYSWDGTAFTANTAPGNKGDPFQVDADITLYALWEMQAKLTFYKVDGTDYDKRLENVTFKLFAYEGTAVIDINDPLTYPQLINPTAPGADWRQLETELASDADGKVSFLLGETAVGKYYQLVETGTRQNYQLPDGQWLIRVDAIAADAGLTLTIKSVNDADTSVPPAFITLPAGGNNPGELALINIQKIVMPATGGPGTAFHVVLGTLLVLGGTLLAIKRTSTHKNSERIKLCDSEGGKAL